MSNHDEALRQRWAEVRPDDSEPGAPPKPPPPVDEQPPAPAAASEHDEHGALADGFRPSDVGNASRLVAAADGRLRYVHAWGRWIVYRGGRWIIDNGDALVTEAAKDVPRRMFLHAATLPGDARDELWKHARRSETAAKIAAMIRMARGMDGVLVDHQQLDADPWLLNVRNGTVDLRTGELRDHDPDDLLTQQAPALFDPDAEAPTWARCLETWQPDPEQRDYLHRAVGSGVSGRPVERFFVHLGDGANGKSAFFRAVSRVLGDYYRVPDKSLLVQVRHEPHATVKADLFRARLVVGAETEQGDRLDESKLKDLTGSDPLRARRMREDLWGFLPTWTLHAHTNYRPRVRGLDEGVWRRLRLIDWPVTIPEDERDDELGDRLAAEASGVLNWLIAGCRQWQERGLEEPTRVAAATAAWRSEEDVVGRFLTEATVQHPDATVPKGELFQAFEAWCEDNGERALSAKALAAELDRRGFDSARAGKARTRTWIGLGLLTDREESQ